MEFDPDMLDLLYSPFSWIIYEILAIILLTLVIIDIVIKNHSKTTSTLIVRIFEFFGFILYGVIFENLGVIGKTYDYSFHRFMMFGVVPLSIPIFEAVIFYTALQFSEVLDFPIWSRPFLASLFGMLLDFTLDPVAVADKHVFDGVLQGRWNWNATLNYPDMFFGIPYFNFSGWFGLMFYYTTLILIGRKYYEHYEQKLSIGLGYIFLSAIIGVLLIISPLNLFLLFAYPFAPVFGDRTAEIVMLLLLCMSLLVVLFLTRKRDSRINLREYPIIWVVPVSIHFFNIITAIVLGLSIAYIPVLLFSVIHISYIGYYSTIKSS